MSEKFEPHKKKEHIQTPEYHESGESLKEYIALAKELIASSETFPFPGIATEELAKMQATDAEFPGFTTPVEVLVARLHAEGMKIVPGDNIESGNIFIVPAGSADEVVEDRYITPRHLLPAGEMDERIKKMISIDQARYQNRPR